MSSNDKAGAFIKYYSGNQDIPVHKLRITKHFTKIVELGPRNPKYKSITMIHERLSSFNREFFSKRSGVVGRGTEVGCARDPGHTVGQPRWHCAGEGQESERTLMRPSIQAKRVWAGRETSFQKCQAGAVRWVAEQEPGRPGV